MSIGNKHNNSQYINYNIIQFNCSFVDIYDKKKQSLKHR